MPAQHITWSVPNPVVSVITTDFDGLPEGDQAAGVYDNSTLLDTHADFEFTPCYDTSLPAVGAGSFEICILPSVDASNYPEGHGTQTGTVTLPQRITFRGVAESVNPSNSVVEHLCIRGVPIPPGKFQVTIHNIAPKLNTGSVSKALKIRPYQLQLV